MSNKVMSKIFLILIVVFLPFLNLLNAQEYSCTSDDCGTIEANWELVNDSLIVCEGATFQVSGALSSPLDEIESFHWYFIHIASNEILFDTLLFDTSYVSYVYESESDFPCNATGTVNLFISLVITSAECNNGETSCNWTLSSVIVKLNPIASFSLPNEECVSNIINFQSSSCYSESYLWDFGDGNTSTLPNAMHSYSSAGAYDVSLTVYNSCGSDTHTESITIIEPAQSVIIPEPGYIDFTAPQPILICLDDDNPTFSLPMNGDSLSTGETFWQWSTLFGYPNASWTTDPPSNDPTPNVTDPTIVFSDTGFVQIILTVDNSCLIPDYDTMSFYIASGVALTLQNQPDGCVTLEYTPNPYNPDAVYTINGDVQVTFPVSLPIGEYVVECDLENECGPQTQTDEFEVVPEVNAEILSPGDTTLCPDATLVLLEAIPLGGTWSGSLNLTSNTDGDSTWYNPMPGETAVLTYAPPSLNCGNTASITITVEDGGFESNDTLICSTTGNFQLTALPIPDYWSSVDCPLCVVGDQFIVSEMVALGLTTVQVQFGTNGGNTSVCESSGFLTVDRVDPIASFIMEETGCSDQLISVDASASISDQPLTWLINGVPATMSPPFNLAAGDYTITLEASYGDCSTTTSQDIVVIDPPPVLNFTATPLEGCAELEVSLMVVGNEIPGLEYNWFLDGVLFSSEFSPDNILLPQGLSDTTYTISLGSANNCGDETATVDIVVHPQPIVNFGTNKLEYCSGDTIFFGNASYGNPTSYFWDFGNGQISTEEFPPYIILFTDTVQTLYPITLIGYNDCGTDTITKLIPVNPTDVNAFYSIDKITA
ncbi:MAG: PKD domain-containing protein, partial [Saprospiraceae bacterium]